MLPSDHKGLLLDDLLDDARPAVQCQVVCRRHFLLSSLAGLLPFLTAPSPSAFAKKKDTAFQAALDELLKGAVPSAGLLRLTVPSVAENGNVVAFDLDASPISQAGYQVERLYLLATDNPWPFVATFHFSPLSGKMAVRSRLRLARSQKVVALAEGYENTPQAHGQMQKENLRKETRFFLSEADVKVVIGGCGG